MSRSQRTTAPPSTHVRPAAGFGAQTLPAARPGAGLILWAFLAAVALLLAALPGARPAAAARPAALDLTVDSLLDEPREGGINPPPAGVCRSLPSLKCTLRAAIETIELEAPDPGATIRLPAGRITLTRGQLRLTKTHNILGASTGGSIVNGENSSRVFDIDTTGTVTIQRLTIENGFVDATNPAQAGFGSHFHGAGIHNHGKLYLYDSTLFNNTVRNNPASPVRWGGGGLTNADLGGFATLVNVTISGNQTDGSGGGIENLGKMGFTPTGGETGPGLINVTLQGNTATGAGGGFYNGPRGRLRAFGTIVAGSPMKAGFNCASDGATGVFISDGYNLSSDMSCSAIFNKPTDLPPNTDPKLDPVLLDNGGPTRTHALLAGSPAIDAIPKANCATEADQRGVPRPQGAGCDIGALEVSAKLTQTITFAPLPAKTVGDAPFTVSATASSGLPVSFVASGACTVAGTTVTLTGPGSCTVTASQAGNDSYLPAPDVARSFTVQPGGNGNPPPPNAKRVYVAVVSR